MDRAEQIVLIKFIQNSIGTNMDFGAAFFAAFLKHTFALTKLLTMSTKSIPALLREWDIPLPRHLKPS